MPRTNQAPTLINRLKRQRAYAWSKYYQQLEVSHDLQMEIMNLLSGIRARETNYFGAFQTPDAPAAPEAVSNVPKHLTNEFEDMLVKLKKSVECPVCLEPIEKGKLKITGCGHKYCGSCLSKLDKCAVCRRKIKK
tara:strand:+ start:432 stop:836 length:405 start_codon:yes stop_codon:yes gene_type:complete